MCICHILRCTLHTSRFLKSLNTVEVVKLQQETMWKHLEPGSSPVDWCEGNYLISPLIAEFVNTVSDIIYGKTSGCLCDSA